MKRFGIIALVVSILGLAYGGYLLGDGYLTTHRDEDPDTEREQMKVRDEKFGVASKIAAASVAVSSLAFGSLVLEMLRSFRRIEKVLLGEGV